VLVRVAEIVDDGVLAEDGGRGQRFHGRHVATGGQHDIGFLARVGARTCRYLAYELEPKGVRAHAISPGPLKTRAASGLKDFELLLNEAAHKAPLGELVDIMDVGWTCAYLATPFAHRVTGGTVYIDGGANIVARAEVANACTWLGLRLDEAANSQAATRISAQESRVVAFVIPTNEELQIATRTFEIAYPG
jgi:hypothetical protein